MCRCPDRHTEPHAQQCVFKSAQAATTSTRTADGNARWMPCCICHLHLPAYAMDRTQPGRPNVAACIGRCLNSMFTMSTELMNNLHQPAPVAAQHPVECYVHIDFLVHGCVACSCAFACFHVTHSTVAYEVLINQSSSVAVL